jgi:hypothetical protein
MALTPENGTEFLDAFLDDSATQTDELTLAPSKTWALDFDNGTIGGWIDDDDAIKQFVLKALVTARSTYLIYSDDYGNEMFDLIGDDVTPGLLDSELPRMLKEALIYDDRIEDVTDITYTRDGDSLYASFTVVPSNGDVISIEEVDISGV